MAEQKNSEDREEALSISMQDYSWDAIQKAIAVHEFNSSQIRKSADDIRLADVRAARLVPALIEQQHITNLLLTAIASKMLQPEDIVKICSISKKRVKQNETEKMEKKGEV